MKNLYNILLPVYIKLWPTDFCLAMWCAPVKYKATFTDSQTKEKRVMIKFDHHWEALRMTLRKGRFGGRIIRVIKKGMI